MPGLQRIQVRLLLKALVLVGELLDQPLNPLEDFDGVELFMQAVREVLALHLVRAVDAGPQVALQTVRSRNLHHFLEEREDLDWTANVRRVFSFSGVVNGDLILKLGIDFKELLEEQLVLPIQTFQVLSKHQILLNQLTLATLQLSSSLLALPLGGGELHFLVQEVLLLALLKFEHLNLQLAIQLALTNKLRLQLRKMLNDLLSSEIRELLLQDVALRSKLVQVALVEISYCRALVASLDYSFQVVNLQLIVPRLVQQVGHLL